MRMALVIAILALNTNPGLFITNLARMLAKLSPIDISEFKFVHFLDLIVASYKIGAERMIKALISRIFSLHHQSATLIANEAF